MRGQQQRRRKRRLVQREEHGPDRGRPFPGGGPVVGDPAPRASCPPVSRGLTPLGVPHRRPASRMRAISYATPPPTVHGGTMVAMMWKPDAATPMRLGPVVQRRDNVSELLAHDLKSPLAAIAMNLDFALDELGEDAPSATREALADCRQ